MHGWQKHRILTAPRLRTPFHGRAHKVWDLQSSEWCTMQAWLFHWNTSQKFAGPKHFGDRNSTTSTSPPPPLAVPSVWCLFFVAIIHQIQSEIKLEIHRSKWRPLQECVCWLSTLKVYTGLQNWSIKTISFQSDKISDLRPKKKKYVVLPFSDRPKILQKLGRDFFFFFFFSIQTSIFTVICFKTCHY